MIGVFRGHLQFLRRLDQEFLRPLSMIAKLGSIGLLCSINFLVCVRNRGLSGREIWMPTRVNVLRRSLSEHHRRGSHH